MKHKKSIILSSIIILIVVVFSCMLFSRNGYKEYSSEESFDNLINILIENSKGNENININEESINSIASSYLNQGIKKGNITLKGFNVNIFKDKVKMLVPIKYKFLPFVLSSEGEIRLNNNELIYTPEDFKVGKITISKEKLLTYIKSIKNNKLKIEDGKIIISSNLFLGKIQIVSIEEGKLVGKINNNGKIIASRVHKTVKKFKRKDLKNKIEKNLDDKSNKKSNRSSLGARQSQMISIINSTISKLDSDISYNYWPNVEKVMIIYDNLNPEEKAKFKKDVFNYVDVAKAKEIKHRLEK